MKHNIQIPLKVAFILLVILTSFACSKKPTEILFKSLDAARAKKRDQFMQVLEDLRAIDSATDQYATENNKATGTTVVWSDIKKYIKLGTRLYNSNNTDIFGNSFTITSVDVTPKVSEKTYSALSDVAPADVWAPFR